MDTKSTRRSGQALLVWGLLVAAANLRASLTGVGPLLDRLKDDLGLSSGTLGLLNTLPLLAFAALSPMVPRLAVRWGSERLLGGALVVLTLGIAVRWLPSVVGLFAGTVLIGAGIAAGNVLLPSLIKRDFPTKVGMLTSAYATVMGGVAAIASGVAVPISDSAPGGWSTALGCWVVLAVVAVLLWIPQMRTAPAAPPSAARGQHRLPWGSGLAWAVTAFMGLQSFGFYVIVTWMPQVFQDSGVSAAEAGWLLFLFQVVAVGTSLAVPGALRWARDQRALATVCSAVLFLGYLGLVVAPDLALLWCVVLGLGGGACLVLALAFLGMRAQDAAGAGALSAMAQSVGYLLAAVGPVLFGLLHTDGAGWRGPLALMCVVAAAQIAVSLVAGRGTVRRAGAGEPGVAPSAPERAASPGH
ncbi:MULTISPECIES: MFS transporter [Kitasatospora]|uniref:Putative major facilitator superfamily transporter n=1 Tax=Kitasatospora setae (strain ATCC 33774 / DSM 43861 / JCM 3304 / KCC A-0304 / NBRC 14216 / KM-6054) TaxID=452652 RepID=E4NIN0_KITSK|nr:MULTISPECIES: MFS transporter [Kitasatospora]BAJ32828.1 putative major facilitator superfamily transporter [Kitasatospora setae KM-6054]